jgi:hypothetical protein
MTEHEIECLAERIMNTFDRSYTRGELTEAMYQQLVKDLEEWTKSQYRLAELI